ncbi:hypothetical protein B0O80DRAFT_428730 [Mortierella sp. GBAus27b]|nr:hypothetical protein BGX31_000310 [Mortierella sp. GBA43]KAI8350081.1 hypothetical protein B0O80DRAFT_428730 [Mortierella sp. GBAus27b]
MTGSVLLLAVLSSLLTLTFLSTLAHGQGASGVSAVSQAAYGRSGSKFYVLGGGIVREVMDRNIKPFYTSPQSIMGNGQFLVLDVSTAWDGSSPAWSKLATGPVQMGFSMGISKNSSKIVAFHAGKASNESFAQIYDVPSNTWKASSVTVPNPTRPGLMAVTDPNTDKVYIAGGYETDNNLDQMYIYDMATDQMGKVAMTSQMTSVNYYAAGWWSKKNSILYFGGYMQPSGDFASNAIAVYNTATNNWDSTLRTTGEAPSGRADMCMAISDDGSYLVVFGGRFNTRFDQTIISDIFVLNLDTLVWKKGRSYSKPRTYASCTIVGDTFLSWGGTDTQATVTDPVIIYDIKRNKYLSKFMGSNPDSDYDPSMGAQRDSGSSGSSGGGGGGGSFPTWAVVLVVGFGVLIFIFMAICAYRINQRMLNRFLDSGVNLTVVTTQQPPARPNRQKTSGAKNANAARAGGGATTTTAGGYQPYPVMETPSSPRQQQQQQQILVAPPPLPASPQSYPIPLVQSQYQSNGSPPQARSPSLTPSAPPPYTSTLVSSRIRGPEAREIEESYHDDMGGHGNSRSSLVPSQAQDTNRNPQLRN